MTTLYVCAIYNKNREPLVAGILDSDFKDIYPLYIKGYGTSIYNIEYNKSMIVNRINLAIANNREILVSDFKLLLSAFQIPCVHGIDYNVYDCCMNLVVSDNTTDLATINDIICQMKGIKRSKWRRIFANASVVYQSIEERGIFINSILTKPIWAQDTYSGRSKNKIYNIQGIDGISGLTNPYGCEDDYFVYFDWVAADLRIASLMSSDRVLQSTFGDSDPYTFLSELLTTDTGSISRDDCKIQLLKAINSFNFDHPILSDIFVDLGIWMRQSKEILNEMGYLTSIIDRKFRLSDTRSELSVLNGILQGSVAHAMQLTIKRIWDTYGSQLLVEIHDSIVVTSKLEYINKLIDDIIIIMTRPFSGILDSNPFFPVKVSIGKKFREWEPIRIYYENNIRTISDAETNKEAETTEESNTKT